MTAEPFDAVLAEMRTACDELTAALAGKEKT